MISGGIVPWRWWKSLGDVVKIYVTPSSLMGNSHSSTSACFLILLNLNITLDIVCHTILQIDRINRNKHLTSFSHCVLSPWLRHVSRHGWSSPGWGWRNAKRRRSRRLRWTHETSMSRGVFSWLIGKIGQLFGSLIQYQGYQAELIYLFLEPPQNQRVFFGNHGHLESNTHWGVMTRQTTLLPTQKRTCEISKMPYGCGLQLFESDNLSCFFIRSNIFSVSS